MFDLDRIQTREQLSGKRCSDLGGKPQCLVYDSLGVHHAILPHRAFSSHTAGPGGGVENPRNSRLLSRRLIPGSLRQGCERECSAGTGQPCQES